MEIATPQMRHVLLIDDEKGLTDMLSMLLETRGYSVEVAHTASDGLQKATSQYDLILLDLVLPDGNGLSVCRQMKEQRETAHIPIIMLSAHSMSEDKVEGLYLGADDFLVKPCDHEELFARMEAVMRRRHLSFSNGRHDESVVEQLRRVLDEGLVVPHFQPIYRFEPFSLFGIEILTRPTIEGALASPELFFKAALQYGLYTEIEIMSWSKALERIRDAFPNEKIFLNCNPYFVETAKFSRVKSIFEAHGVSTNNVILEITERSAISDFKNFYDELQKYRDFGFRFAVDDVGGGYASLESIVQTRPEVVKIDRHIVYNCSRDSFKRSIIKFIVSFCQENHIISVAEGIESRIDLDTVRDLGVSCGQGFYLFKPTATAELSEFTSILS